MRRSKLEMHVDILKALASHEPLKLAHIMCKTNINCSDLKQCLKFLIERNIIEEQILYKKGSKKSVVYTIAERGLIVLKRFRELNKVLRVVQEAH